MKNQYSVSSWSQKCDGLLEETIEEARRMRHPYIGVEHAFNALLRRAGGVAERLMRVNGMDPVIIRDAIRRESGTGASSTTVELAMTPRMLDVLIRAEAAAGAHACIGEKELLRALLNEERSLPMRYLVSLGHEVSKLQSCLVSLIDDGHTVTVGGGQEHYDRTLISESAELKQFPELHPQVADSLRLSPPQTAAPGQRIAPQTATPVSLPTPTLDKLGRDLAKMARLGKLCDAIGREAEIEQIITVLARTQKSNPLLLGEAGVGKTAIVEGLAWRIAQKQVPSVLLGKRVVEIDMGSVTAGTSLRGQFEEKIRDLINEATNAPEVILFIDEIHTIVGAGKGDGAMDAAQMFKPALARGEISCIGATTHDEFNRYIRKDPALERRFSPVSISEMTPESTLRVLQKMAPRIMEKQSSRSQVLVIAPEALHAAVSLTDKYVKDRNQPDKAIDAIDIAAARAVVRGTGTVSADDVAQVVADWTGIPTDRLTADRRERFARMEQVLSQRVIGQDAAVATVSRSVRAAMAGMKPPNRPIGAFLFVGPSGVGKTRLAKELAAFLFDTPEALIRFDMGEFHDKHTVSNLLGSPRGYIGSDDGGRFSEELRRRPYSVVLLDEIEKAHPDVFDIFLSVFDDGRITDNRGHVVDCSNALFILTSNLTLGDSIGFDGTEPDLRGRVAKFLRPELVNRLTDVVKFEPLGRKGLALILDQILYEKSAVFHAEHGITISLDESARNLVLQTDMDPQMGARPLERAVERMIVLPLVDLIFAGQAHDRELLAVDKDGAIVFLTTEERSK